MGCDPQILAARLAREEAAKAVAPLPTPTVVKPTTPKPKVVKLVVKPVEVKKPRRGRPPKGEEKPKAKRRGPKIK